MTKDRVWEIIVAMSELHYNGECKECGRPDEECSCLAGSIRHFMGQVKDEANDQ